jgi:hypothetical protein
MQDGDALLIELRVQGHADVRICSGRQTGDDASYACPQRHFAAMCTQSYSCSIWV